MKPLVIYHANCTNGFGAAFAAWLKFGDEAEYLPMDYMKTGGKSSTDLLHEFSAEKIPGACISEREVFILDFSLPRCVMDWIFQTAKRVVWLDHRKTAFEMWCETERVLHCEDDSQPENNRFLLLDNNKSGAMLAWEYFHPGTEVPMLIQHIDDRWQFKLDGSKELHAALRSYEPWTFDQWWRLFYDKHGLGTNKRAYLIQEGNAILRAHDQNVQACLKQALECRIYDIHDEYIDSGFAANAPSFLASDLGSELANKSGTFGLVWSMAGDGQVHCSLRSNGEYDVSAIAKAFGGGGHRNAAGFSTDIDTLIGWLK